MQQQHDAFKNRDFRRKAELNRLIDEIEAAAGSPIRLPAVAPWLFKTERTSGARYAGWYVYESFRSAPCNRVWTQCASFE